MFIVIPKCDKSGFLKPCNQLIWTFSVPAFKHHSSCKYININFSEMILVLMVVVCNCSRIQTACISSKSWPPAMFEVPFLNVPSQMWETSSEVVIGEVQRMSPKVSDKTLWKETSNIEESHNFKGDRDSVVTKFVTATYCYAHNPHRFY